MERRLDAGEEKSEMYLTNHIKHDKDNNRSNKVWIKKKKTPKNELEKNSENRQDVK